ncbi:sorting nexin-21 isoform X1 [Anas platyrhynchos]|uniref:sorting nexin-21 isoform X1 n=1 Tax=Anas platyrhynchos TaxID=8839 RepID=UPI003AF24992
MAARILHRLRHALGAEGAREERAHDGGEAEDCPESSELEDDTEGLSTRLSGTLSFASHEDEDGDEDEDEEDGTGEEPGEPTEPTGEAAGAEDGGRCRDAEPREWDAAAKPPGGSLLTRQLQELWRKSRSSLAPQRLLFEVTSASVVSERSSKYVEEAAAQLHGRDHRQAQPSLRAVPVPPALHRRDPPLPRVPRVLLSAGPAGRPAPDLHRHVPRGPGHLGQRLPAAGAAGGLRLRPLPPDTGRAGRVPPGAGPAGRGARLLRAGAAAAGGPGQPPAAGALPPGSRPPGLEGGQGQAALGGPAAGPAGGWAAPAAAAQPEGVSDQGASRVRPRPAPGSGSVGAARRQHQGGSHGSEGEDGARRQSGVGTTHAWWLGAGPAPLGAAPRKCISVSVPPALGARCPHHLPGGRLLPAGAAQGRWGSAGTHRQHVKRDRKASGQELPVTHNKKDFIK